MSLPAGYALTTITATCRDRSGGIPAGTVEFEADRAVIIGGVIVYPKILTATLDGSGEYSIDLPSTNDPDLNDTSGYYWVRENFDGGREQFRIYVPYDAGTLDMADIPAIDEIPAGVAPDALIRLQALITRCNAATTEAQAAAVAAEAAAERAGKVFYVDPIGGSDSTGTGAMDAPFQTLSHAAAHGGDFTEIRNTSNGPVFVEELYFNLSPDADTANDIDGLDLIGIRLIGTKAAPFVFNALDRFSGSWTKLGGYTNIYYKDVVHAWGAPAHRGYPGGFEDNLRLIQVSWQMNTYQGASIDGVTDDATAKAYVDATPGSFQCVLQSSGLEVYNSGYTQGATFRYYVHASDSGNPGSNGKAYCYTNRRAPNLGTGNHFEHVIIIGGHEHNGVLGYLGSTFKHGLIAWPGAHGHELIGCSTENLTVFGNNTSAYTKVAFHNFTPSNMPFDIATHKNAAVIDWTGPFSSAIAGHTDGGVTPTQVGRLITFDGLYCDNVASICGGTQGFVGEIRIKDLKARDCGSLGAPVVNYVLDNPVLHLTGESLFPAAAAGFSVILNDLQLIAETIVFRNRVASAGKLIINRGTIIQLGVTSVNAFAQMSNDCESIEANDCAISGPLGAPNARLGVSGSISSTTFKFRGCTIDPRISLASTYFPDATCVRADPMVRIDSDYSGVTTDAVHSPHRFRHMVAVALASAPGGNDPNDALVLCKNQIRHLAVGQNTFQETAIASLSGLVGISYIGDSTDAKFAAWGTGGVLYRGTVTAASWALVNVGGRTKNWTGVAGNTNAGQYIRVLTADDGSLTKWDISSDTFTNLTSPVATPLRDITFSQGLHVAVGDSGVIAVSSDATTFTKDTSGVVLSTDNILHCTSAIMGGVGTYVCVGISSTSFETVIYYGIKSGGAIAWNRFTLGVPLLPSAVAMNTSSSGPGSGDIVVVGSNYYGQTCAYKANVAAPAAWSEVTGMPLDNLVGITWRASMTVRANGAGSNMTIASWVVTGPAFRAYYSRDLQTWAPGNPWTAYVPPSRTHLEDSLLSALLDLAP